MPEEKNESVEVESIKIIVVKDSMEDICEFWYEGTRPIYRARFTDVMDLCDQLGIELQIKEHG